MKLIGPIILFTVAFVPSAALADDGSWGHLSGRFVYDGMPPFPRTIEVTKDQKELPTTVPDESLIVNAKNYGIANVLIYLLPTEGTQLRVHSSYEKSAEAKVPLVMREGRFEPHILLLRTSQIMVQENKDGVGHAAQIQFHTNSPM